VPSLSNVVNQLTAKTIHEAENGADVAFKRIKTKKSTRKKEVKLQNLSKESDKPLPGVMTMSQEL